MNTIWGSDREPELNHALSSWAAVKLDAARGFGPCSTMGVFDGPELLGVMVYHNWNPETGVIEISGAAGHSRWLTKPVLNELFGYPFDELGCQMVVMRVSERNVSGSGRGLHRLLPRIGFSSIRVPRLYGRDEAGILHCLTHEDWRASQFYSA